MAGEPYARDSAYALFMTCYQVVNTDPGRVAADCKHEFRDRSRGVLVGLYQVEYYRVSREARRALYTGILSWWCAVEVPANMFVPLPAVFAHRSSALIRHEAVHWAVFKKEWDVDSFG
jgi:hypothetical protein